MARLACLPARLGYESSRLGVPAKVIQQILRHADVTTTMNIYVKSSMGEATAAMKALEAICATNVQPFTGEASPVM